MKFSLFIIILLATTLRLAYISVLPPSLNWDEVSIGYNAYAILKTGRDEWGDLLPIIFRAFGDYKLPGYIYSTTILEFFFGLTPLSVRLTSVLSGVGIVITTFFLAGELLKGLLKEKSLEYAQILSALLVAIEPWGLFISRIGVEANLATFFVSLGILLLLRHKFPLALLFLGLSVWTYNSARIFAPLFLLFWLISNKHLVSNLLKRQRSQLITSFIVTALFFIPMFIQILMPQGQARFKWISLLDESSISQINQSRTSYSSPFVARLIHNKLTYLITSFSKNYVSYLSPQFLFLKGGSHYQFNVPDRGLLYTVNLPFLFAGLVLIFRHLKLPQAKLILSWLLIAPIAGSITKDSPHTLRALIMLPVPMILSSIGVVWVSQKIKPLKIIYSIVLFASFIIYSYTYTYDYSPKYSWVWQYGYREVADFIKQNPQYATVITTKKYGEPHEFFLFYLKYDPALYLKDINLVRYPQSNWFWVDRFNKYWFINDWQIKDMVTEKGLPVDLNLPALLITSPNNYPPDWKKLKTVYFLDGKPGFDILEMT